MELPIYTTKSNVSRVLIPKILKLLGLAVLLYVGVWLNFSVVLNNTIPMNINYLVISIIIVLVLIEALLTYRKILKNKYYFFVGRIEFKGKNLDFRYFKDIKISKNIFDKIFKTGTIKIQPDFKLESVSNPEQISSYIQQLVQRIRPQITQQTNQQI